MKNLYFIFINIYFLAHNEVNKRLEGNEISNDPAWPKVPFPTKQQCNSCVTQIDENGESLEFDENETYKYFKEFYSLKNIALRQKYNHLFLLYFFLCFIFNHICY
jgi:hypothetical protein